MTKSDIQKTLFSMQDKKYAAFQAKLTPNLTLEDFIGVRTPDLKKFAKQLYKEGDYQEFLNDLPHKYFDENQLHAFIIAEIKDYDTCIKEVNNFLPYVNNWATCDQLSPKAFTKNKDALLKEIKSWIKSKETYTIRFAMGNLMRHFLEEDFNPKYPEMVAKVKSKEYYVNMMIAWYFATALAKQYDTILPYIKENKLDVWTHNKTIQKAVESDRIAQEQKTFLKQYKRKE